MQTLTYVIGTDKRALVSDVQNFQINWSTETAYNWVQARQYESSMRQVFVNVKNANNTPFDLTGCNIWFEGLLPDDTHRILDAKHATVIDAQSGQFRFDFPAQAFAVAGSYKQAFFRIVRDGMSVTTLEFDLEVLADKVISGVVATDYITPFEDLYSQLEEILTNADGDLQAKLSEWTQEYNAKVQELTALGTSVTTSLTGIQNRLAALETKIEEDGLLTQGEANALKLAVQKKTITIFSTVAEMKAATVLEAGMHVRVLGFYSAGDSGLADYVIEAEEPASEAYVELDNGLYAQMMVGEKVNARQFGAKIDGTTNDSLAINKAIAVAIENYPKTYVELTAGEYSIANQIVLPPYIKLRTSGTVFLISRITGESCLRIKWLMGGKDPDLTNSEVYEHQDWQRGVHIDGSDGGLILKGSKTTGSTGIEFGFRSTEERDTSNLYNMARSSWKHISCQNFDVGIAINSIDFFMNSFEKVSAIDCTTGWIFRMQDATNSGETINLKSSGGEGCDTLFDLEYGGHDLYLYNTFADFNKTVFKAASYGNSIVRVQDSNIEGNDLIVDANRALYGTWLQKFVFEGCLIYVNENHTSNYTQFVGSAVVSFRDTVYISPRPTKLEYVCGDGIKFDSDSGFPIKRDESLSFFSEKENEIAYADDWEALGDNWSSDRTAIQKVADDSLPQDLKDFGIESAFKFHVNTLGNQNWENLRLSQKITTAGKTWVRLLTVGLITADGNQIDPFIVSYDCFDTQISMQKSENHNLKSGDLSLIYSKFELPKNCAYIKVGFGQNIVSNNSEIWLGYAYAEVK